jgi:hypothetical protein
MWLILIVSLLQFTYNYVVNYFERDERRKTFSFLSSPLHRTTRSRHRLDLDHPIVQQGGEQNGSEEEKESEESKEERQKEKISSAFWFQAEKGARQRPFFFFPAPPQ